MASIPAILGANLETNSSDFSIKLSTLTIFISSNFSISPLKFYDGIKHSLKYFLCFFSSLKPDSFDGELIQSWPTAKKIGRIWANLSTLTFFISSNFSISHLKFIDVIQCSLKFILNFFNCYWLKTFEDRIILSWWFDKNLSNIFNSTDFFKIKLLKFTDIVKR